MRQIEGFTIVESSKMATGTSLDLGTKCFVCIGITFSFECKMLK